MSSPRSKPVVLIVTGAWHQPAHYQALVDALEADSYAVAIPQLPSFDAAPHISMLDDALEIRRTLDKLLAVGWDVIVLAHSYGGLVATEAVTHPYLKSSRTLIGRSGGVVALIYMTAFLLAPGQTLATALGGGSLPPHTPIDVSEMSRLYFSSSSLPPIFAQSLSARLTQ